MSDRFPERSFAAAIIARNGSRSLVRQRRCCCAPLCAPKCTECRSRGRRGNRVEPRLATILSSRLRHPEATLRQTARCSSPFVLDESRVAGEPHPMEHESPRTVGAGRFPATPSCQPQRDGRRTVTSRGMRWAFGRTWLLSASASRPPSDEPCDGMLEMPDSPCRVSGLVVEVTPVALSPSPTACGLRQRSSDDGVGRR